MDDFEEHHSSDDEMQNLDGDDEMGLNDSDCFNDDEIAAMIAREEGNVPQRSKKKPKTVEFRYGMFDLFLHTNVGVHFFVFLTLSLAMQ